MAILSIKNCSIASDLIKQVNIGKDTEKKLTLVGIKSFEKLKVPDY